jgi:excisionase family DNA binding protein
MADAMANQASPADAHSRERIDALDGLPILIPVPRAAKLLGISRSAAYRCAASGDLPSTHLGGRVYVVTRRLQELLESA